MSYGMKREYEATHVTIEVPDDAWHTEQGEPCAPLWSGAHSIVLDTGDLVWISASYMHGTPKGVTQVGGDKAADRHGNMVLSVPAAWCTFLDQDEANKLAEEEYAREADAARAY